MKTEDDAILASATAKHHTGDAHQQDAKGKELALLSLQIATLPLDRLVAGSLAERAKFRAYQTSDPTYSLEIFHRAMLAATDENWEALHSAFQVDVVRWVCLHPAAAMLAAQANPEEYAQEAFIRLYYASRSHFLAFPTLAAAMSFLRRCVNSVMLDHMRSRRRETLPIDAIIDHPANDEIAAIIDRMQTAELWRMVEQCLTAPREVRLARLLWIEGYKPREVAQQFPAEFTNIVEVRRLIASMVQRLRRHYARAEGIASRVL